MRVLCRIKTPENRNLRYGSWECRCCNKRDEGNITTHMPHILQVTPPPAASTHHLASAGVGNSLLAWVHCRMATYTSLSTRTLHARLPLLVCNSCCRNCKNATSPIPHHHETTGTYERIRVRVYAATPAPVCLLVLREVRVSRRLVV